MVDALYFSNPIGSNDASPAVKKNLTENGVFSGYANAAALAAIPAYMLTAYGALAPTADGALNVWNGSAWAAFSTAPTGPAGGDLAGTYPNPTVRSVTGAAGVLAIASTAAALQHAIATTAPTWTQLAQTADVVAPQEMSIAPQAPYASASGARRNAGDFAVRLAAPASGGAQAFHNFYWGGSKYGRIGLDASNRAYLEAGATASVGTVGTVRNPASTVGLSWLNLAGSSTLGIVHRNNLGDNELNINPTNPTAGLVAAQNLILNAASYADLQIADVPKLRCDSSIFYIYPNTVTLAVVGAGAKTLNFGTMTGNNPAGRALIQGMLASVSATGANRDGGYMSFVAGAPTNTNGRYRTLDISTRDANDYMLLEVTQVQPEVTDPSDCIVLCGGQKVSSSTAPTGSGRLFGLWGPAFTAPTVKPGAAGWTNISGDSTNGGMSFWSNSDGRVKINRTDDTLRVESVAGTTGFSVSAGASGGVTRRHRAVADNLVSLTPTEGGTVTIADTTHVSILEPAAARTAATLVMPAAPVDGQRVRITCGANGVSTLTHNANTGQTIRAAATTAVANTPLGEWQYRTSDTTWLRIG